MKRLLVLAALCATCLAPAFAQTRFGLDERDYALALTWLQTNCLAPEANALLARLRDRRDAMQRAFTAAAEEGPTHAEVALAREGAIAQYRRQREVAQDPLVRESVPAETLRSLLAVPEAEFVRTEVENYVNGYRSNAMSGLAVVGDDAAIQRLARMAQDPSQPLAAAARAALAYRAALRDSPPTGR